MCKDNPNKCSESGCRCKKPSKLDDLKYWWKHQKNTWFERKRGAFNYFIVRHLIVPYLNRMINESPFVKYFDREWKLAKWVNKDKEKEMRGIVSLVSLLDNYGYTGWQSLNTILKVFRFEVFTPLKLDDSEFNNLSRYGDTYHAQNSRRSCVFKYAENYFVDIDALGWITKARYDLANKENGLNEPLYGGYSHHGRVIMYDEENKTWTPLWSGQRIKRTNRYEGKYYNVPCIEIFDSTDKHNDYFCFIINKKDIPVEFYDWFYLTDIRTLPNRVNDSEVEETMKYLEDNHLEDLLNTPVKKAQYIENVSLNFTDIRFNVYSCNGSQELYYELIDNDVNEDDIRIDYHNDDDKPIEIIINNKDSYKNAINKIIEKYGVNRITNLPEIIEADNDKIMDYVNHLIDYNYPQENIHVSVDENNQAYKLIIDY